MFRSELSPPASADSKTGFASICFWQGDCIRTLGLPHEAIDGLRKVIQQSWTKGIQKERFIDPIYPTYYEFKLLGNPWRGSILVSYESLPSRILSTAIFAYLFSAGWILHTTLNDEFILRQNHTLVHDCNWISITCNENFGVVLFGAEPELIAAFRDMLTSMEHLKDESCIDKENNIWQFRIKARSLKSDNDAKGRMLRLRIAETLELHGWTLYTNTRMRTDTGNNVMGFATGWYCLREKIAGLGKKACV